MGGGKVTGDWKAKHMFLFLISIFDSHLWFSNWMKYFDYLLFLNIGRIFQVTDRDNEMVRIHWIRLDVFKNFIYNYFFN